MLKLDDFKKLTKSQVLNARFVRGGDDIRQTLWYPTPGTIHDDWAHTITAGHDNVGYSDQIPGGGNPTDDPAP